MAMALDLKAMGCDFYASCGHKWLLGPSGTGFLYVSLDMLDVLQAEFIGAYSDTGWTISEEQQDMKGYVDNAHRFYYGTQSAALSSGLKAAVDFMNEIDMARVETYSKSLANYLREELATMEGSVQILTPLEEASRSTMISFKIPSMDYREFGKLAAENNFRIRLVPESGLNAIRISTHIYNNKSEIDRFILMVAGIVKARRQGRVRHRGESGDRAGDRGALRRAGCARGVRCANRRRGHAQAARGLARSHPRQHSGGGRRGGANRV